MPGSHHLLSEFWSPLPISILLIISVSLQKKVQVTDQIYSLLDVSLYINPKAITQHKHLSISPPCPWLSYLSFSSALLFSPAKRQALKSSYIQLWLIGWTFFPTAPSAALWLFYAYDCFYVLNNSLNWLIFSIILGTIQELILAWPDLTHPGWPQKLESNSD